MPLDPQSTDSSQIADPIVVYGRTDETPGVAPAKVPMTLTEVTGPLGETKHAMDIYNYGPPASNATNLQNLNVTLPLANTEASQALPNGTKFVLIKARNIGITNTRLAFAAGDIALGNYFSIDAGISLTLDSLNLSGKTIYLQVDQGPNEVVELIVGT